MAIIVKEPFELRATLTKMKAAKEQGVGMAVWDSEIKAVEDAIATIEAIRAQSAPTAYPEQAKSSAGFGSGDGNWR